MYSTTRQLSDMESSRRRSLDVTLLAVFFGAGWIPTLASTFTNPAVSLLDQPFELLMLLSAASLLSIGLYHFRHPELVRDPANSYESKSLPLAIIVVGPIGIGVMVAMIVS
ncbi:hypothetical protein [Halococcus sediminicola]|uniref:hypothetical protein n=1 Tax=Halococcus sediminicola TaxID=1264579 RepID=UPI0012AB7DC3|nr:hypothetical protein [Halococcus sediminicola]